MIRIIIALTLTLTLTTADAAASPIKWENEKEVRDHLTSLLGKALNPMGPVDWTPKPGPTMVLLWKEQDKAKWEANKPPSVAVNPSWFTATEKPPQVEGLVAFRGKKKVAKKSSKDLLRFEMKRRQDLRKKARPTIAYAVGETGRAYGRTFAQFGRSLAKNLMGE